MAIYDPFDVEPAQIQCPPKYQKVYNFLIRIEQYHATWYQKDGINCIGYADKSFDLSNPANRNHITENMARGRLLRWIEIYDKLIDATIEVPLTAGQRNALISYVYSLENINEFINGPIVRVLNQQRAYSEVPIWLRQAIYVNGKKSPSSYLTSRRMQEIQLWSDNSQ